MFYATEKQLKTLQCIRRPELRILIRFIKTPLFTLFSFQQTATLDTLPWRSVNSVQGHKISSNNERWCSSNNNQHMVRGEYASHISRPETHHQCDDWLKLACVTSRGVQFRDKRRAFTNKPSLRQIYIVWRGGKCVKFLIESGGNSSDILTSTCVRVWFRLNFVK